MEGVGEDCMKRKNNKGLTLIELLVALAIVSVVMGLAFGFIIHTVGIYNRGSNDSLVQNDAQLTMSQLETLVVNANMGIGLDPDTTHANRESSLYLYYRNYTEMAYDGTTDSENEKVTPYEAVHVYVDPTAGLCFNSVECTYGKDASGKSKMNMAAEVAANKQVLSKYVKDFKVDLSNLESKSEMKVTMKFTHRDKEYETSNTIKLRNKVASISDQGKADSYFEVLNDTDQKNKVIGISMSAKPPATTVPGTVPTVSAWAGTTFAVPFQVEYTYNDNSTGPGQTVWSVSGGAIGVNINRMTGMVTIDPDYSGGDIEVYATALSAMNQVTGVNTAGALVDKKGNVVVNEKNRTKGVIKVKSVKDPVLSTFTMDTDPQIMRATLTFPAENMEADDVNLIHPQATSGLELKPQFSSATLRADGTISYEVTVKRPINYKRPDPFTIVISSVVNGKTLTASGTVRFVTIGVGDTLDGVMINVADSQGSQNVNANETLTDKLRGDKAVLTMSAVYKDTSGNTKTDQLSPEEWKLRCDDGTGVTVSKTSEGYSLGYNVMNYAQQVKSDMVFDYVDEEGNWVTDNHFTLIFQPVILTADANSYSQSAFPITRGSTVKLKFTSKGVLNPTLYVYSRDSSKVRVSVSGFDASITAASNMSAAETITFGLKKGSTILSGVEENVKFYPGAVNTRTFRGGNLTGDKSKYAVFIPVAFDIRKYDSSKSLTTAVPCSIYTAEGKQIIYHDYSNDDAHNRDKNGSKHQYWMEYEGKTFFYHEASRQWRLNE